MPPLLHLSLILLHVCWVRVPQACPVLKIPAKERRAAPSSLLEQSQQRLQNRPGLMYTQTDLAWFCDSKKSSGHLRSPHITSQRQSGNYRFLLCSFWITAEKSLKWRNERKGNFTCIKVKAFAIKRFKKNTAIWFVCINRLANWASSLILNINILATVWLSDLFQSFKGHNNGFKPLTLAVFLPHSINYMFWPQWNGIVWWNAYELIMTGVNITGAIPMPFSLSSV